MAITVQDQGGRPATKLSFRVDFRSIERAGSALRQVSRDFIAPELIARAGGVILLRSLKEHAPVGKGPGAGAGRDSIKARGGTNKLEFWGRYYLHFVDSGTKPHIIMPTISRATNNLLGGWLVFDVDGRRVFAKLVHHPGTKPTRWISKAVSDAKPALRVLMLENGRRMVKVVKEKAS